jgi:hypothetical protein
MRALTGIKTMKRLSVVGAVLVIVGAMQASAAAAPVQVDFNVAGFGPTAGTTSSFTKDTNVFGDVDLTFTSMNASLQQANLLYWDAFDGGGFADGFGVMGSGSYEDDEVEGDERLGLSFSRGVNLLGFNLTDFFNEQAPSFQTCAPQGTPNCYREVGFFMVQFGNGTTSGWLDMLAYADSTLTTNGVCSIAMNFDNVTGLLFRAPGQIENPNFAPGFMERHEFSLAGVRIDEQSIPAPEPATMSLVALGLAGVAASRRRRENRP